MLEQIVLALKVSDPYQIKKEIEKNGVDYVKIAPTVMDKSSTLIICDDDSLSAKLIGEGYAVLGYPVETEMKSPSYIVESLQELETEDFEEIFCRLSKIPLTVLTTKRCIVREIQVEDVDSLYEIYNKPGMTDYLEPLFNDRQEEIEYTRSYIQNIYGFYGYGMWIVTLRESGIIIGRAGLEWKEEPEEDSYGMELGYLIDSDYQRQGYAKEVCSAICQYAFGHLQAEKVYSMVMTQNRASCKLCEKLGFINQREVKINHQQYYKFELLKMHQKI